MPRQTTSPPFDLDAARARLRDASGPRYWRSLEELADAEGFQAWLKTRFPQLSQDAPLDRRGFLKFIGASMALAGLTACSHPPQTELVPYVHGQSEWAAGLPRYFATTLTRNGYAQGVLVRSDEGRPTKIEGNPQHPASLGATDIFAQAAILQLWDPDRSQSLMHAGEFSTWEEFAAAWAALRTRFDRNRGQGLRVLTRTMTSPTLAAQLAAFQEKYPDARWHVHEPGGASLSQSQDARGAPISAHHHFDRARVILALDADFLSDPAGGVRYSRDFIWTRDPERGAMSRLYAVEPTPSITGMMADHRLPLESARIGEFAQALTQRLDAAGADAGGASMPAQRARWLDALADDLRGANGASLIVAGFAQAPAVHAAVHAMNIALGNVGTTVEYGATIEALPKQVLAPRANDDGSLRALAIAMRAGQVDTLLVLDGNPVYDAPADLEFAAALQRVPHLLHLGLYRDETGALAEWHLPMSHELEAWGDARAFDGTASIAQPLIAPLYGGKSAIELMSLLLDGDFADGRAVVKRQWSSELKDDDAWNAALQAGVVANTALPPTSAHAPRGANRASPSVSSAFDQNIGKLELLFRPDPTIGDGDWSNNGWLQELPKPLTQLAWDNVALISPTLAAQHRLNSGDVVELRSHGRKLRAPIWIMPGQAPRAVTVHLGYGRTRAGRVGNGQGYNAYALRTSDSPWQADDLQIVPTGERYELATTQHHFNLEGRDLVRTGTLVEFLHDPRFASAHDRYDGKAPSLYPDYPKGEYAWGMSIDLNACIGCKACTIACQSENNIPVVGKDQVHRGREMHWIRVDHYYEGDAENPAAVNQPVPCMMCEHAPCELVCPVDATVHDSEGLNVQVYNRCVGTRFCSNNCPYKVRRFNFLQYADKQTPQYEAMRNPEVSVRRRGVMEKCTYCIQRIETAHIAADKENRKLRDGEVVTACQAVCPTQAIRFGDIADPHSAVSKAKQSPRNYAMLAELGTRPRTTYLARIRNPNPALKDET
ncbi:MAG TPA: TAT-variant-translocated molybdopterin oxidoreductase [Rhodanobacteraceae bacterium]